MKQDVPELAGVRTVGQVGGAVSIRRVDVLRGGCGHLQVDHLPCVLQGRHSVLMQDILKRHMVYLPGSKVGQTGTPSQHTTENIVFFPYSQYFVPDL